MVIPGFGRTRSRTVASYQVPRATGEDEAEAWISLDDFVFSPGQEAECQMECLGYRRRYSFLVGSV